MAVRLRRQVLGDLDRRFLLPILASFSSFVGIGALVPVLPFHIHSDLGLGDIELGLVVGAYSVAALGSRIAAGRVVDSRGGVVGLRFGLVVGSVAGLLFFVPAGLPGLLVARMCQGVGAAFVFASGASLVVDLAPVHQRARAMSLLGTGPWGGVAIGPFIGGLIGSYVGTALFIFVMPLPMLWFVLRWRAGGRTGGRTGGRPTGPSPAGRAAPSAVSAASASLAPSSSGVARPRLIPREALLPGISLGLVSAAGVTLTGFLVLRLADIGGGGGTAYGVYAASVLATRVLLGGIVDRIGSAAGMALGAGLGALGLAVIAVAPLPAMALGGAVLCGIGLAFPWLALVTFSFRRVGEHEKGAAMGVLTAVSDAATFTGSLLAGVIAGALGYPAVFLAGVASLLVSGALVIPAMRRMGPSSRPPTAEEDREVAEAEAKGPSLVPEA